MPINLEGFALFCCPNKEYVLTHLQPLVYTFSMELVITGQHPEKLTRLKVTHTHHTSATQNVEGVKNSLHVRNKITLKITQKLKMTKEFLTVFALTDGCWG